MTTFYLVVNIVPSKNNSDHREINSLSAFVDVMTAFKRLGSWEYTGSSRRDYNFITKCMRLTTRSNKDHCHPVLFVSHLIS